jgi:flagellar assembly protein FliH
MNIKENFITPDENTKVQNWQLPGIVGESINSGKNRVLNYVNLVKEEDELRAERELKIQEELQKGFQEGLVKGKDEAFNSEEQKYQDKIVELSALIKLFEEKLNDLSKQIENEMPEQVASVVLSIAKAIIRVEVQSNKEIILQTIKEALQALPRGMENIKCFINPQSMEVLNKIENPDLKEQLTKLELIADESLTPGGCLIKTMSSTLDATLETRTVEILTRAIDELKHN